MSEKKNSLSKRYGRVMPRVYNRSLNSLKSGSFVTRHEAPSSDRVGAKPSVSNLSSGVFSDLPIVLNDYKPDSCRKVLGKRTTVVKPRRTLKSLDPALSPPRPVLRSQEYLRKPCTMRLGESAPAVLSRQDKKLPESHLRQYCTNQLSSRSKLREIKEEIKSYQETEKLLRLRSRLYKSCGVVLDDMGQLAADKSVQADPSKTDLTPESERFPDDPHLKEKWIAATGNKDWFPTKHSTICSIHFDEAYLRGTEKSRRLLKTACPTLHIVNTITDKEHDTEPYTHRIFIDPQNESNLALELRRAKLRIKEQDLKIKRLREQNRRKMLKIRKLMRIIVSTRRKSNLKEEVE